MDQPYPEEVKASIIFVLISISLQITASCIFFAGNKLKLAHENSCSIRGFREDIRSVRCFVDKEYNRFLA